MAYNPNNPNGQAAMINSAPVAIALDQSAIPINIVDTTTGGYSAFTKYTTDSTNTGVIAGSRKIMGWYVYNDLTGPVKLCFYDLSTTPTGSEIPYFVIVIPATSGANVSFPNGIQFTNSIAYGTSSNLALGSPTPVLQPLSQANKFIFTIFYK